MLRTFLTISGLALLLATSRNGNAQDIKGPEIRVMFWYDSTEAKPRIKMKVYDLRKGEWSGADQRDWNAKKANLDIDVAVSNFYVRYDTKYRAGYAEADIISNWVEQRERLFKQSLKIRSKRIIPVDIKPPASENKESKPSSGKLVLDEKASKYKSIGGTSWDYLRPGNADLMPGARLTYFFDKNGRVRYRSFNNFDGEKFGESGSWVQGQDKIGWTNGWTATFTGDEDILVFTSSAGKTIRLKRNR